MMLNRHRPWLALLISALVHVAVALVLIGPASRTGAVAGSGAQSGPALVVTMVSAVRAAPPASASASAPASAPRADAVTPAERRAPVVAEEAVAAAASTERASARHYFGASEITEPAVVADGLAGGEWLIVPGFKPQTVDLQVWVSDEGLIDRVELETSLTEAERQLLLAAFAKVRFLPGRIGRIAVHSRLSMRIRVDYTLRA